MLIILVASLIPFLDSQEKSLFIFPGKTIPAGELPLSGEKRHGLRLQKISLAITTPIGIRHDPHVKEKFHHEKHELLMGLKLILHERIFQMKKSITDDRKNALSFRSLGIYLTLVRGSNFHHEFEV
jgi:hypothetical protein